MGRRGEDLLSLDSEFSFSGSKGNERLFRRKLKIDSKGRISIPSEIRKNFRLEEGFEIELVFDLKKNFVMLFFGQDGVKGQDTAFPCRSTNGSTEVCGTSNPGSSPGPGPKEGDGDG
jgi:AbrB family looped-hinge helix DNA binding protein